MKMTGKRYSEIASIIVPKMEHHGNFDGPFKRMRIAFFFALAHLDNRRRLKAASDITKVPIPELIEFKKLRNEKVAKGLIELFQKEKVSIEVAAKSPWEDDAFAEEIDRWAEAIGINYLLIFSFGEGTPTEERKKLFPPPERVKARQSITPGIIFRKGKKMMPQETQFVEQWRGYLRGCDLRRLLEIKEILDIIISNSSRAKKAKSIPKRLLALAKEISPLFPGKIQLQNL